MQGSVSLKRDHDVHRESHQLSILVNQDQTMCCETIDSTSTSNTESGDAENCQLTLSEEKNKSTQKKKVKTSNTIGYSTIAFVKFFIRLYKNAWRSC